MNGNLTQPEEKKDVLIMEKEELKELIYAMIKEALNACAEEKKEETVTNETEPAQPTPEKTDTTTCDVKKEDEVKNEEVKEEVKEEMKEEEVKKAPEKPEVIKIEALNSAPVIGNDLQSCEWKNLHGEEFFAYLRKHPEVK